MNCSAVFDAHFAWRYATISSRFSSESVELNTISSESCLPPKRLSSLLSRVIEFAVTASLVSIAMTWNIVSLGVSVAWTSSAPFHILEILAYEAL